MSQTRHTRPKGQSGRWLRGPQTAVPVVRIERIRRRVLLADHRRVRFSGYTQLPRNRAGKLSPARWPRCLAANGGLATSVPEAADPDGQSRVLTRHSQTPELPTRGSRAWGQQPDKDVVGGSSPPRPTTQTPSSEARSARVAAPSRLKPATGSIGWRYPARPLIR
jgi:hypothetical protein